MERAATNQQRQDWYLRAREVTWDFRYEQRRPNGRDWVEYQMSAR